jgi:hypothetical protein
MPRHLQQHDRADAVIAMNPGTMRHFARILSMSVIGATLAVYLASCNNQTGFSGSVGNTPNAPRLTSYEILGDVGTPFTATVSDSRSSWTLQGDVPLSITIANNVLPARIVVTKTTASNNLLSIEIIGGNHVADLQSTSAPFGTVSVQVGGSLASIAPAANPDLRIVLLGPLNVQYQALVEDSATGFIIQSRAPTVILFDNPNGKVDATFFSGGRDFGNFTADMTLNGQVVVPIVARGPNLTIREP